MSLKIYSVLTLLILGTVTVVGSTVENSNLSACNPLDYMSQNNTTENSSVELVETDCKTGDQEERVISTDYSENNTRVNFTGLIQTPTPCYTVEHQLVEESENQYTVNIVTVPDDSEICIQCIGALTYNGSVELEEPFALNIEHNGEHMETVEP